MAKQSAWVIGLGVPGGLALLLPATMRASGRARRIVLLLVVVGAALGYGVGTIVIHMTSGPTPLFSGSGGAIVLPGLYLALRSDGATFGRDQRAAART